MTSITPNLGSPYKNLKKQGEAEVTLEQKLKPLVTSLRNSDTSSFVNSAYLIDLSDEAKALSEYQQNKNQMNEMINNWLASKNPLKD